MLPTVTGVLAFALPYAAFTFGGVLLWRRARSGATAIVVLGFAAAFLGQVADLFMIFAMDAAIGAQRGATLFVVAHYRALPLLAHYAGLLGLWAAALGFVWHAGRRR